MPELKFNIGAMIDVASSKELADGLSGLQGHIEKHAYKGRARPIRKPQSISSQIASVNFGGSTVAVVGDTSQTPSVGRLWIVRSAFVYNAAAPLTAGLAGIVCGLAIGDVNNPTPADLRGWTFTGTPAANTFGTTALHVQPNESVYVVIGGALPANSDLSFNYEVDEYVSCEFEAQRL